MDALFGLLGMDSGHSDTGLLGAPGKDLPSKTNQLTQMLASALPMVAAAVAAKGGKAAVQGIKAYHGSPHDFDRFSLSKIGTGEGAQVYGHGLYFAENEGVAKSYRNDLTRKYTRLEDPTGVGSSVDAVQSKVFQAAYAEGVSRSKATEIAQTVAEGLSQGDSVADFAKFVRQSDWDATEKRAYLAALAEAGKYKAVKPKGGMYEVNIKADPEQFLDWDKPLSQQPKQAQEIYAGLVREHLNTRPIGTGSDGTELVDVMIGRSSIGVYPKDKVSEVLSNPAKYVPLKGRQFYEMLASAKGGPGPSADWGKVPSQAAATETLKAHGIPGIKYLDGASRSAGEGSRNYVVFDDALVEILRKYGLLAPLAAPIAYQRMGAQPLRGSR